MSRANWQFEAQNAVMTAGTGAAPSITLTDQAGNALRAFGVGAPTVVAGYAPSCIYQNLGLTGNADAIYVNLGTALVANWTVLTVA